MNAPLKTSLRLLTRAAAAAFALQVLLAVAGIPPAFYQWMTGRNEPLCETPRHIVVLGGGGIPSATGLMRTYCAAEYGRGLTGATFVVCLPADGDPERSSVGRMRDELVMRGIPAGSIRMEYRGRNTHQQAENVRALLGPRSLREPMLVVTSPPHARRALLCFRKAGFLSVGCEPAENTEAEAAPGRWTWPRYAFWSTLVVEIEFVRELCALACYKLRGWI
jgi:uncharacterized SAM-binding protein YcdF (DUF218 family)